jgi:hypothetical protein
MDRYQRITRASGISNLSCFQRIRQLAKFEGDGTTGTFCLAQYRMICAHQFHCRAVPHPQTLKLSQKPWALPPE